MGQLSSNSANLCDSGLHVGLFIISRQHTQTWNIALRRRWVLAAGKKQGARRCRRNANECPLSSLRFHLLPWHNTALHNNSILASGLIAMSTAAQVLSLILSLASYPLINTYKRINLLCYGCFAGRMVQTLPEKPGFLKIRYSGKAVRDVIVFFVNSLGLLMSVAVLTSWGFELLFILFSVLTC